MGPQSRTRLRHTLSPHAGTASCRAQRDHRPPAPLTWMSWALGVASRLSVQESFRKKCSPASPKPALLVHSRSCCRRAQAWTPLGQWKQLKEGPGGRDRGRVTQSPRRACRPTHPQERQARRGPSPVASPPTHPGLWTDGRPSITFPASPPAPRPPGGGRRRTHGPAPLARPQAPALP